MIAAIEIGGTKFQLALADRAAPRVLIELIRQPIDRIAGADGILQQVADGLERLQRQYTIEAIGVGFGGPVDIAHGRTITSHQVHGWNDFPLVQWFGNICSVPVAIGNDCNVAALAEATWGAGRGRRRVLYVTVGTGIGGGFVVDGRIDGVERPAVAEIGHLRPGMDARAAHEIVESFASGLGIEQQAAQAVATPAAWNVASEMAVQLREFAAGRGQKLTVPTIAAAAAAGQPLALQIIERATNVLGWALAQATTLMAPERIVIGGGVALIGPEFFEAIRRAWRAYVFPPLREACDIVPAELGEEVVLHGALELARLHSAE